ncbi:HU family DNA-binding protein [Actinomadura sp. ATCC 31491]|uniref:HU family DNA-binding protein n=2 Tax=Streptosporangiales TaxID=85012 RepID=A0ABT0FK97_9ACTN|nr:HU family DNA-binding protein [Actinomadura luzonensis]MCK2212724.1 HU family DNA-binding protein [Actinomadura luzonensis]
MNKRELVEAITDRVGDKRTATEAVNAVIDTIQKAVASGDKVSITGFGAFEMVNKPARTARNPSTGAEINVAESWAPKFRPGSEFKDLVNEGGKKSGKKK